jgi:hypothetical protein
MAESCDAMLLGSLLKSSSKAGIWPPPETPYSDVDFKSLVETFRNIKVTALCDSISRVYIDRRYPVAAHGFKQLVEEKVESLKERLCGLDLEEFQKNNQKGKE